MQDTPLPKKDIFVKAIYKDGQLYRQPFDHPDYAYNGSLDVKNVHGYFIVDQHDNIYHGIDLVNRRFIVGGSIFHTDLPDGEYKLIAFKRTQVRTNDPEHPFILYCLGLEGNIDGKVHKRVLFLYPDGTYMLTHKT